MNRDDATQLLNAAAAGDPRAADRLMPLIYENLRGVAGAMMGRAGPDQTLQPTALVNEAYLKLVGHAPEGWAGRTHFFAVAATAMRQILIDYARARGAAKRGGDRQRITLDAAPGDESSEPLDAIALAEALTDLAASDARAARVVELKFFAGLRDQDIAQLLGVSERTIRADWRHARAWLRLRLGGAAGDSAAEK